MRTQSRITLTLVLFALFASAALPSSGPRAARPEKRPDPALLGSITGSVKSGGSPVLDATVHVWKDGKEVGAPHVDPKGEFQFPTPEGTYEVQAAAPHFQPAVTVRITVVVHAQHETWVNLEMRPGP